MDWNGCLAADESISGRPKTNEKPPAALIDKISTASGYLKTEGRLLCYGHKTSLSFWHCFLMKNEWV